MNPFHRLYSTDIISKNSFTYTKAPKMLQCTEELERIKFYLNGNKQHLESILLQYFSKEMDIQMTTKVCDNVLRIYEFFLKLCIIENLDDNIIIHIIENIKANIEKISYLSKIEFVYCMLKYNKNEDFLYILIKNLLSQNHVYKNFPSDYYYLNYTTGQILKQRHVYGTEKFDSNWFMSSIIRAKNVPKDIKYIMMLSQCSTQQLKYYDAIGQLNYCILEQNFPSFEKNMKYCISTNIAPEFGDLIYDSVDSTNLEYDNYIKALNGSIKEVPSDIFVL